MANKLYKAYLQTKHWRTFREFALEKRGRKCEDCGKADGFFDIHHLTYENIGEEQLEDVLILCRTCHKARHPEKGRARCAHENITKSSWEAGGTVIFGWSCAGCRTVLGTREPDEKEKLYAEKVADKHRKWVEKELIKKAEKEAKKKEKEKLKPKRKPKKRKPYKKRVKL